MLVATQIWLKKKLLAAVQSYVARGSINVSSMRGSSKGTIPRARKYQDAASRIADRDGVTRVHLDALWWGDRQDGPLSGGRGGVPPGSVP